MRGPTEFVRVGRAESRRYEPVIEDGGLIAGRHRLQRRVGEGGMGEVWQAFNEHLGGVVAVKPHPGRHREDHQLRHRPSHG